MTLTALFPDWFSTIYRLPCRVPEGSRRGRNYRHFTIALCLAFCPSLAHALDEHAMRYPDYDLDFALELSRQALELSAADQDYTIRQSRLGLVLFDISDPVVNYGFIAGYTALDIEDDAVTAGVQPDGYHFGLTLRTQVFEQPRARLQAHYLFQEVSDATDTDSITLSWHEWQVSASLRFALTPRSGVILGGGYSDVEADRRSSGATDDTLHLKAKTHGHGYLQLEMLFPENGRASLSITRGAQQGLVMNFSRDF